MFTTLIYINVWVYVCVCVVCACHLQGIALVRGLAPVVWSLYLKNRSLRVDTNCLSKKLVKASVTVGLVVLLLKRALVQLLQAECAHEMLRMELLEHGRDAATSDRLRTSGAQWSAFGMVMRFAVGKTFVVEERATLERLTTVLLNIFSNRYIYLYIRSYKS